MEIIHYASQFLLTKPDSINTMTPVLLTYCLYFAFRDTSSSRNGMGVMDWIDMV